MPVGTVGGGSVGAWGVGIEDARPSVSGVVGSGTCGATL